MIQIEGERGQETEKIYTLNVFMHSLFHCISQILKKKFFSLSNSLFYKEKRGLNGVPPI